jgi:hypothetical protein
MSKKKSKSVSFDAMVKFFMQHYGIPTKVDVDRIIKRLDRMEKLIKSSSGRGRRKAAGEGKPRAAAGQSNASATDQVLNIIGKYNQGAGFAQIHAKTGFDEKKIRNILYRLHKLKKIERRGRRYLHCCLTS